MKKDTTTFTFRIDPDLKKAFEEIAESRDQTASQALRWFMRDVVEANKQPDLFPTKKQNAGQIPAKKKGN